MNQSDYKTIIQNFDAAFEIFKTRTNSLDEAKAAFVEFVKSHYFDVYRAMVHRDIDGDVFTK